MSEEHTQLSFFEEEKEEKRIIGDQEKKKIKCFKKLIVSFDNPENFKRFSQLLNLHLTMQTKGFWFKGGAEAPAEEELTEFADSVVRKNNSKQDEFFEWDNPRLEFWKEMPEFIAENLDPFKRVLVFFANEEEYKSFADLIGQKLTDRTQSIWYPYKGITHRSHLRYISSDDSRKIPKYPIFILSKGRADCCLTAMEFERIGVPYHIVVEPQEVEEYAKHFSRDRIIATPFSNLGQGGIPSRNFIWELGIRSGKERHWIMDDNIRHFYRFNNSFKWTVGDGTVLRAAEDFTDRFSNVDLSGLHYDFFCEQGAHHFPYIPNTRIYSCILIKNSLPFRWRARYNEDTDLSLRVLKRGNELEKQGHPEKGGATILFNAFLAGKQATMTMKGGNMETLYQGDGRLKMAESLQAQHPDVTQVGWRYNRWQHWVDYSQWEDRKLILKPGLKFADVIDDYGMELKEIKSLEEEKE